MLILYNLADCLNEVYKLINFGCLFVCLFFSLTGGGGGGGGGSEKAAATLEQKLFKLQEELTELHRQKGEVCLRCRFNQPLQGPKLTVLYRRQMATEIFFSRQMEKSGPQKVVRKIFAS